MKYTVLQSYTGNYSECHNLQLSAGQEIELEPMVAEWVNRDRPGTLIEYVPPIAERPEGEHETLEVENDLVSKGD